MASSVSLLLKESRLNESHESKKLREEALSIVNETSANILRPPETLLELLTSIIKPLFSASKHPSLTSSGRRSLVPQASGVGRLNHSFLDEDGKPWKNGWTTDLLIFVLSHYQDIPIASRKSTLEAQFHLLVPPILNLIDDNDIIYKAAGCRCLRILSEAIVSCKSHILKRTGLTEVFIDALKPNFLLLPTLTPEDESLSILKELYPAYRALVSACFTTLWLDPSDVEETTTKSILSFSQPDSSLITEAAHLRQFYLTTLVRHGLLYSLSHLSTAGAGITQSVPLTTYLISQLTPTISDMGIYAAKHLQTMLPFLRAILCDPFAPAVPELLIETLGVFEMVIRVCWPRVKEKWWGEILRGAVGAWCGVLDEATTMRSKEVKEGCKRVVQLLSIVVGEEWEVAKERLVRQDEELVELFN